MPDTLGSLLRNARTTLREAGIKSAALDARLLLQAATHTTHEDIIASPETPISRLAFVTLDKFLARRTQGEPVSRILGTREFFGRSFAISPAVLDPRADTETLIDLALFEISQHSSPRIIDLGTGSGALIITLLAERLNAAGTATDISPAALAIASQNARTLGVSARLNLLESDWFSNVTGRFDLIISNPPYIPYAAIAALDRDVRNFDPHLALDGGAEGLAPYHLIARRAAAFLAPSGMIIVEFGAGQGPDVSTIFAQYGFMVKREGTDLGGHLRCLGFCAA